jgi:hypothetical protein
MSNPFDSVRLPLGCETGSAPNPNVLSDVRAALLRGRHRIGISFGEAVPIADTSRARFLGGDREAARRLVSERVWPEVRAQVQALRERPALTATGGGSTLVLVAGLLLRRRWRRTRKL